MKHRRYVIQLCILLGLTLAAQPLAADLLWHYECEGSLEDSEGNNDAAEAGGVVSYTNGPVFSLNPDEAVLFPFGVRADLTETGFRGEDGEFSLAYWINLVSGPDANLQANVHVLDSGGWGGDFMTEMKMHQGPGGATDFMFGNMNGFIKTTYLLPEHEWHHMCWTYTGTGVTDQLRLYIDGLFQESADYTVTNYNNMPLFFGASVSWSVGGSDEEYTIGMDDIRFYDHILDADEVGELVVPEPYVPFIAAIPAFLQLHHRRRITRT
jgi:hypothetical protein